MRVLVEAFNEMISRLEKSFAHISEFSSQVVQKSLKEGFGLTVAEGMWKGKPVIGGFVGGITAQIVYGQTGFTVNSAEGCAYRIRYLLNNPEFSQQMGQNAKEYVRRNFLITRNICDYLALMVSYLKK